MLGACQLGHVWSWSAQEDVLFDVANVPGLPLAVEQELNGGRVGRIVKIVGALDRRVADQGKVHERIGGHG